MKTKNLFLCIISFVLYTSCQKEFEIVKSSDDFSTIDGCNYSCYTYSGTPVAGESSYAYSMVNFSQVESVVNPIVSDNDITKLSKQLVAPFSNPYEKVYAIYYWIALNLKYDYDEYERILAGHGSNCDLQNSSNVLYRKLGVCEGISNLFCALCKSANMSAVKIIGKTSPNATLGHAWSAIQIEGKWYLIDATWDLMYKTKGKTYFLADPQDFYVEHIPNDSKWKLFWMYYNKAQRLMTYMIIGLFINKFFLGVLFCFLVPTIRGLWSWRSWLRSNSYKICFFF